MHYVLEFNRPQWLKTYLEFNTQKKNTTRKFAKNDGKTLYKLMVEL